MHKNNRDSPAQILSDVLLVLGAAIISTGVGLIYLPAGIISAGTALMGLGILLWGGDSNAAD